MIEDFAISERPKFIKDFVGNKEVKEILMSSLAENKLPHAIMFCNSLGCGKTSFCYALANELDVPDVNIHKLDMGLYANIDSIRELADQIQYIPLGGEKSVYIMEEVHKLSGNKKAQEGLLYTLENIPEHAYIFATTTNPEQLLPTFLSRFEPLLQVHPLTEEEMLHGLIKPICNKHNFKVSLETAKKIYNVSDGCPRVALRILYSIHHLPPELQVVQERAEYEENTDIMNILKTLTSEYKDTPVNVFSNVMNDLSKLSQDWEANRQALLAVAGNYFMRSKNKAMLNKGVCFISTFTQPCTSAGYAMFSAMLWSYISTYGK